MKISMKKISLFFIILFLVVALSGCGKKVENNSNTNGQTDSGEANPQMEAMDNANLGSEGNKEGILAKLKNAISSGKVMKCTYKMNDLDGSSEIITYMQGDKYKTELNIGQVKTSSVFDGDSMYSWSAGQKTGTKMTMDCINSLNTKEAVDKDIPSSEPIQDDKDFMDSLKNSQDLNCEDAKDIDFSIPSDVTFIDQCEMLKSQQKMIEGFNK
ncbi:MAG: hypothetical protein WC682_01950 [Parcubacteria group bacterium]|jgi:uncharacterized protein YceK